MNLKYPRRFLLSVALVVALTVFGNVGPASAAYATPTGLKVTAVSSSTVDLTWNAVSRAPRYRIQMATKSDMSGAVYFRVTPNQRQMTGLKASTKYYFKVRVITADGGNLSSYSGAVSATTQATPTSTPTGLKSTAHTEDSVSLTWNAVPGAPRYRIQMATNPSMSGATYYRVTPTNRVMTGLTKDTTYYFKVRVITADGVNLSRYSPAISVTTTVDPPPDEFTHPAPGGLASPDQSAQMLSLTWNGAPGAPRYRIQLSTNPDMAGATYYRFAETRAQIAGLAAGTKYYLKVRVIDDEGVNLSPYSGVIAATTRASSSPSSVAPFGLAVKEKTTSEIDLTWLAVSGAPKYEVQRSTSADMSKPVSQTVTPTAAQLADLAANTNYYVRVRAASATGAPIGNFTSVLPVKTQASATPQPLRVSSYNVKCANCDSNLPEEGSWAERRASVVGVIMGQKPDVVGIQEASQGWLSGSEISQFEDLRNRLKTAGGNYQLANAHRNNCVKSTTPSSCSYKDQGASKGTKVYFNADTVELVSQGSKRLESACSGCNERYVAWAILRQKSTGKKFFFANTHIEPTATYAAKRIVQTRQIIAEVALRNPDNLPEIVVGDFNSTRYQTPSNAPYDQMIATGLVDPLGQTYKSPKVSSKATAEKRIHANYNSFSDFRRAQTFYAVNENGSNLDYIFTSPMRVTEWETAVSVDAAGRHVGRIPSDHNMIRATVLLP